MRKVTVKFDRNVCVGYGSCVSEFPENFAFVNNKNKADLLNSKLKGGDYILEKNVDEDGYNRIIRAAKKCPVNAIEVEENGKISVSKKILQNDAKEIKAECPSFKWYKDGFMPSFFNIL